MDKNKSKPTKKLPEFIMDAQYRFNSAIIRNEAVKQIEQLRKILADLYRVNRVKNHDRKI